MSERESNHQSTPPDGRDESLSQQIRALPGVVWVLFAGMFINRFGTFVVPFLTLYLTEQGYRADQIASIFLSMAIGGMGAMALGGRFSDLFGRKNTMAFSLFSGGLSMLLIWGADSWSDYLWTACLSGLTHGIYHPASNSLLADVVPSDRRVTAFAVVRWGLNLGFACGMIAGGVLAEKNFAYLFIGDAATSILYGVMAIFLLPHGVRTDVIRSRWKPALQHMWNNRPFRTLFFANLLITITFFQWGSSIALLVDDLGYSKRIYGYLMGLNGLMITLFEIPLSQLARRLPRTRVIACGFFLCGFGLWLNAFAHSWVIIAISVIVFTLGEIISMPISGAYIADLAPEKMRGRYAAASGLTWNLAHAFAPGLGILLYKNYPDVLWWGLLLLGIASAALMLTSCQNKNTL